jgi:hypothetical protein
MSTDPMALSWRQRAHYIREIQELVAALIKRLDDIDATAAVWVEHDASADRQLADETNLDEDEWDATMAAVDASQAGFFGALEGCLSAWARLSLLFFPNEGGDAMAKAFKKARGAALRDQLMVADDHPLGNRDLRNSWMHFDERMDQLISEGRFGDRQRFVSSRQVADFLGKVPRLMAVDTRTVYSLRKDGATCSVSLPDLRSVLNDLSHEARLWWRREPRRERAAKMTPPVTGTS